MSRPTFREIERSIDGLKRRVDEVCDRDLPNLGVASPDRRTIYDKVTSLKNEVNELEDLIAKLSLRQEKLPTSQFESKKDQESKRLRMIQDKLNQISNQLEPDEVEEDYFRHRKMKNTTKNKRKKVANDQVPSVSDVNSVADAGEEGLTNEEDDEDYESETETLVVKQVQGLTDFEAAEEGDLGFRKGDLLTILETREDGWWLAKDSQGKVGIVPSTYLKVVKADEVPKKPVQTERQFSSQCRNFEDKVIRSNPTAGGKAAWRPPAIEKKRSGKDLWEMVKQPKQEKTSELDVLKALKAMPAGFRESTLGTLAKEDSYKTSSWVIPKLSKSNLAFRDVFWDPVNKKLRARVVFVTRTFTILAARMIPPAGAGLDIKSRHVRIALWDGKKVLSNIHTVRAIPLEQDDLTWSFNPRVTKTIPTLYDAECVVRSNLESKNMNVLFELNYSYVRTTSGERGEVSCGWSSLPLFENDGTQVVNKTYDLNVHGGTPYDKGVDLDPAVSLQANTSLFQSLIRTNRQPRLTVKCTSYNRLSKDQFDLLPDCIVTNQSNVKFISYFREIIAQQFARDDSFLGGSICDPVLAYFAKTLDYPDVFDAMKRSWDEKMKSNIRRTQKRDPAFMLGLFRRTFIETSYAIMQCVDFPPYDFANEEIEKERLNFILSFQESRDPLAMLLSRNVRFRPLNTNKLAFDILSEHSLPMEAAQPS